MKNVLHIQLSSKSAGSSAWRLHQIMSELEGYSSEVLSLHPDQTPRSGVTYLQQPSAFISKLNNKLEQYLFSYDKEKYGLFSNPLLGTSLVTHPSFKKASVVYIHWVQLGFLTLGQIEQMVKTGKQIIFVMHDMWWITGGCHVALDCRGYESGCLNCPIFRHGTNFTQKQALKKKQIFSYPNVSVITPSKWLKECVENSFVGKDCRVTCIPNYFNLEGYAPSPRDAAEKKESRPKVISFAAVNISSVYKGFKYLRSALEYLPRIYKNEQIEIHLIGAGTLGDLSGIPYPVVSLGYLEEEKDMARALAKADVYVIPSIAENQPTVIIESLSCGVPVVGFKVGGIPDMIDHMKNGYLAEPLDYKGLAEGIKYCLENELVGYKLEGYQPDHVLSKHLNYLDAL